MATTDRWDPAQYNKFAAEREQPFWDLARLLEPTDAPRLVDLGCGDGRLTAQLSRRLGASSTVGIDSSESMIAAAAAHAAEGIHFELGDIGKWSRPDSCDIVLASASMHWVPDHGAVLARWSESLRPGGQLAIQVPANADHPAQRLAAEVAIEWLDGEPPSDPVARHVLPPERYAELLDDLGFTHQHVRLQVYPHHLGSTADVVEWLKGTTLTRFKKELGPSWGQFVDAYRHRLLALEGDQSPYFFPFKRILMWGRRD